MTKPGMYQSWRPPAWVYFAAAAWVAAILFGGQVYQIMFM